MESGGDGGVMAGMAVVLLMAVALTESDANISIPSKREACGAPEKRITGLQH